MDARRFIALPSAGSIGQHTGGPVTGERRELRDPVRADDVLAFHDMVVVR
jgi:hypothetical protein